MPKGICLLRKVGDKNILVPIAIEILGIDSHASSNGTIWIQRTVCFQGNFLKSSVTVIAKEKVWDAIVGLKDVHLSIVVVIEGNHAQTFADMFSDSCFLADVGEGAVAVVVKEHARRAFKPGQITIRTAFKKIASHFTVRIEIQIITNEKIQITVIVVVKKSGA